MPDALPVAAVTQQQRRVHLELFGPTDLQLSPDTIMPPEEMLLTVDVDGSGVKIMQPGQQPRGKTCNRGLCILSGCTPPHLCNEN